jgi:hypothetical protein
VDQVRSLRKNSGGTSFTEFGVNGTSSTSFALTLVQ